MPTRAELVEDLRSAWENVEDDGCDAAERAIWTREIRRLERELGLQINEQPRDLLGARTPEARGSDYARSGEEPTSWAEV